jgi:hypothetical protein
VIQDSLLKPIHSIGAYCLPLGLGSSFGAIQKQTYKQPPTQTLTELRRKQGYTDQPMEFLAGSIKKSEELIEKEEVKTIPKPSTQFSFDGKFPSPTPSEDWGLRKEGSTTDLFGKSITDEEAAEGGIESHQIIYKPETLPKSLNDDILLTHMSHAHYTEPEYDYQKQRLRQSPLIPPLSLARSNSQLPGIVHASKQKQQTSSDQASGTD